MEVTNKDYTLIIAGYFNLSLGRRDRGKIIHELYSHLFMEIANGYAPAEESAGLSNLQSMDRID